MKALVKLRASDQTVALMDIEPFELPSSGHARVRVGASGICGTDLHIIDGSYSSRPPVALGHEVAGTVVEVSPDVDVSWVGARVAMETFYSTCGTCEYCRSGHPNMCANRLSIGSGVNGGFAESVVVPIINLHRIPDWLSLEAGTLSEPLACVCQSLFNPYAAVNPGDKVLIAGPGAVGLLAAQVARAGGGQVIIAGVERDALRLELARSLGFETRITPFTISALPPDWRAGPDVVIECSGNGVAMRMLMELLKKRGRYVQMGQTADLVSVPLALVSFKELVITGGFASTRPHGRGP